jgi:hypothetical protein
MIEETIARMEESIGNSTSLDAARKKELLDLLSSLRGQVTELSKTHPEHAESIAKFTDTSLRRAMRKEKGDRVLEGSLHELSASVERFESSHATLVQTVNSISLILANMGI